MSVRGETRAASTSALYEAKALAELAAADALVPGSDSVAWRGALLADVAVVKGLAGPAEAAGGRALEGRDGEAVDKALEALGHNSGLTFYTLSRPVPDAARQDRADRIRLQLEAVGAELVICLDSEAAEDVAAAFDVPSIAFGVVHAVLGRRVVAVDGLEASLDDARRKARVWRQLKSAEPQRAVL